MTPRVPPQNQELGVATRIELIYIFRFVFVGVLNTIVGLGSIYLCKYFLHIEDVPANIIGYLVGLTNSFLWNSRWTFSYRGNWYQPVARFLIVFGIAYAFNLVTMLLLKNIFGVEPYVAHAIATFPFTAISYLGSRYFVFVRSNAPSHTRHLP